MVIKRNIDLAGLLSKKSYFLLGPRQTGKTSAIAQSLPQAKVYNLLDHSVFVTLSRDPTRLRQELVGHAGPVVIDEIQKLPQLLDEVQIVLTEMKLHFLLTGSSARKLRRGGVNLLGGRARSMRMHPFIANELGQEFDLLRAINYGTIPSIYLSPEPSKDLRAYTGEYLQQEILAEGLIRNITSFSRFLEVAALCNGQIINYQKVASDTEIARTTIQEYFAILKDTMVAEELTPWQKSKKRKSVSKSKYYFFDVGVANALQNVGEIRPRSKLFGDAFETYIFHEMTAFRDYCERGSLHFWRSDTGSEVDIIFEDNVGIEIKGKERVTYDDLKGLLQLKKDRLLKKYIVVCLESTPRTVEGIEILPWRVFLDRLWGNDF